MRSHDIFLGQKYSKVRGHPTQLQYHKLSIIYDMCYLLLKSLYPVIKLNFFLHILKIDKKCYNKITARLIVLLN